MENAPNLVLEILEDGPVGVIVDGPNPLETTGPIMSQEGDQLDEQTWNQLYRAAMQARENAWAPYSKFHVGAALLLPDGDIVTGCNVENATYGATVCAERTAVGCAVAEGHREFSAICIITDLDEPAAPCGICRQVLAEFCDDLPILLANPDGERVQVTLSELLPRRFSGRDFAENYEE